MWTCCHMIRTYQNITMNHLTVIPLDSNVYVTILLTYGLLDAYSRIDGLILIINDTSCACFMWRLVVGRLIIAHCYTHLWNHVSLGHGADAQCGWHRHSWWCFVVTMTQQPTTSHMQHVSLRTWFTACYKALNYTQRWLHTWQEWTIYMLVTTPYEKWHAWTALSDYYHVLILTSTFIICKRAD